MKTLLNVAIIWTFNSLFEIHHYAGRAPDRLELLSILFLRFLFSSISIMGKYWKKNFQFSFWDSSREIAEIIFWGFKGFFQFSFWDSGLPWIICALAMTILSILFLRFANNHKQQPRGASAEPFNSLFEIRLMRGLLKAFWALYLSILFLRFIRENEADGDGKWVRLSILFLRFSGPGLGSTASPHNPLSILFLRFLSIRAMNGTTLATDGAFQFSFWDSFPSPIIFDTTPKSFQFSFWDSRGWIMEWRREIYYKFQFSFWDSRYSRNSSSTCRSRKFQFSFWDSGLQALEAF